MQLLNATRAQTQLWASVSNYSSHSDINTRTFSRAVHTLNCLLSSFFTRADWWVLLPPGYRCPLYIVHCTDIWTKTRQCNSFSPSLTNVNLNPTWVTGGHLLMLLASSATFDRASQNFSLFGIYSDTLGQYGQHDKICSLRF